MPGMADPFGGGGGLPFGGPLRGSQVGPNDPIFGDRRRLGPGPSRFLPPGARYDPINPPGMRGFHPDDFVQPEGGDRVHPDVMDFRPPGGGGMDHMFG